MEVESNNPPIPSTSSVSSSSSPRKVENEEDNGGNNNNTTTAIHGDEVIQQANWPTSCPHRDSSVIISVVCSPTRYQWALHESMESNYSPTLFWKTTALDPMVDKDESSLVKYLPFKAFEMIGGPNFVRERSFTNLIHHNTKKRIPYFHVYIIADHPEHARQIPLLFSAIPCRIIQLRQHDFFPNPNINHNLLSAGDFFLGPDQCASLYAAVANCGNPVLVMDGGTALTWMATDSQGNIQGGAILPGIVTKIRALTEMAGILLNADLAELKSYLDLLSKEGRKLPTFAKNTKDAIYGGILRETALYLVGLVREWDKESQKQKQQQQQDVAEDTERPPIRVVVTGAEAWLLERLLSTSFSNIIEDPDGTASLGESEKIEIIENKNLASTAVGMLLHNKAQLVDQSEHEILRQFLLGQRIGLLDEEDGLLKRGTVYHVQRAKDNKIANDIYKVKLDDGSVYAFNVVDLYDCLMKFSSEGEEESFGELDSEVRQTIRNNAKEAATKLADLIPSVKKTGTGKRPAPQPLESPHKKLKQQPTPSSKRPARHSPPSKKAPTKKLTVFSITRKSILANPEAYVNRRVAKMFGRDLFFGTVKSYHPPAVEGDEGLWHVQYDDEDNEDYDIQDMVDYLKEYEFRETEDKRRIV